MPISPEQIKAAEQRGRKLQREYEATEAHYDRATGRVVVSFPTEIQISFLPKRVEGLSTATEKDLEQIELSPSGLSLHFPTVDADVYIPALMQNILGSKTWMARIGSAGGAVRSERKTQAARQNGKLGGRPKVA